MQEEFKDDGENRDIVNNLINNDNNANNNANDNNRNQQWNGLKWWSIDWVGYNIIR